MFSSRTILNTLFSLAVNRERRRTSLATLKSKLYPGCPAVALSVGRMEPKSHQRENTFHYRHQLFGNSPRHRLGYVSVILRLGYVSVMSKKLRFRNCVRKEQIYVSA